MSAMRKAIQYLGFDTSQHEEYEYADEELAPVTHLHDVSEVRDHSEARSKADRHDGRRAPAGDPAQELRRIQTVTPRTYSDARLIGEAFRQGVPVIMNLAEMSDGDAKRLVDFAAGLSFGLHGSIERVTTAVFLLSPAHVEIGVDEEPPARPDREFFNEA
ncbi:cell division protein SepF [Demequina sediminicola]|uniref:cell division protein SepF n=1 Tax=Demequina sediminicola TaxID=1095026 RepID=UPI000783701F|nr:cell division protein SepF [Demequina sediminicola]